VSGERETIVSGAPQGMPPRDSDDRVGALLAHADDNLVLAQRLGEWISKAPDLEIDIALGNTALDHLGVARALYRHAGELEGEGRDEDDLAMRRDEREYTNLLLVEQPNGDFAHTMLRQLFFDAYQTQLWEDLSGSDDPVLAGIAAKAAKETAYHLRYSSGWVVRLGDGTEESCRRAQAGVDALWRFTQELTEDDRSAYRPAWERLVASVFSQAGLEIPGDSYQRSGGRLGYHTEHLGYLLAEMQWMQRSHPGLDW
jgi:ring-1,2-phenylacetyl-CoA epoxidase subunit PaaC